MTAQHSMQGHRVDEIHAHPRDQTRSWLTWLVLGLLAVGLLAWAFARNRSRAAVDTTAFHRAAEMEKQRVMQDRIETPAPDPTRLPAQ